MTATPSTMHSLKLTRKACTYLKKKLRKGQGLRIQLKKSGCSGWLYQFEQSGEAQQGESILLIDNFTVFLKHNLIETAFKNVTIDCVRSGLNEHLTCINPNEGIRCGCGESFTLNQSEWLNE